MWLIFDWVFGAVFSWIPRGFKAWRRRRLVIQAQGWARVTGRGFSAQARSSNSYSFPTWTAEIGYTYVVEGRHYSGFTALLAEDEKHAEGLALGWKDREVLVRYLPGRANVSTLLLSDQGQPLATVGNSFED